jgi:hypothetical protein
MSAMGQKAKYSLRADIVRFAPESGLKSDIAGGPFRANRRHWLHSVGDRSQNPMRTPPLPAALKLLSFIAVASTLA